MQIENTSILLVDDHPTFRLGMVTVLNSFQFQRVEEATNLEQLFVKLAQQQYDLILLDIVLGQSNSFNELEKIRANAAQSSILILSAHNEPTNVQRAIDLGAQGFICKSESPDTIFNAIKIVLQGGTRFPQIAKNPHSNLGLTPRQQEITKFICQGFSNKYIAQQLNITEGTLRIHLTSIYKNLGVKNRTEASRRIFNQGLEQSILLTT